MPEAGRCVKCSETQQRFLRTSYPHMQTLSKEASYPHPNLFQFYFFSTFFPSSDPVAKVILVIFSPCSALCPTYQVYQSQSISHMISYSRAKMHCCWYVGLHSSVMNWWFHPYLTILLLQQTPKASKETPWWEPQISFSFMSQYQIHSVWITH